MREILEDAAIVYRQEAENLLIVAAPAVVLGPVCVLIAASGLQAAIISIPVLMVLYVLTYATSLRAARLILQSDEPDPLSAFASTLAKLPAILILLAPFGLLMATTAAASLIVANEGYALTAFALGLFGALVTLAWVARHAYDLPLVLAYGVGGFEALRAGRNVLETAPAWNARIFVATGLPLMGSLLICWGLWTMLSPAFGASVFAALAALWMPFAALSFMGACTRLVGQDAAHASPA